MTTMAQAPFVMPPTQGFPQQFPPFGYPPIRNQNPIQLAPPLYVGDLDENIREEDLFHLFSKFGQIYYIRLMRDPNSGKSRGFAYVNFTNPRDAEQARLLANHERLGNKNIRILYRRNIKSLDRGNIFVKNIDKRATVKDLHQHFSRVGPVLSAKLALDSKGESRGYGYVQFENAEDSEKAIEMFKNPENSRIKDQEVEVFEFKPREKREQKLRNNIYIKHLPEGHDEKTLEHKIREFLTGFYKNETEFSGEVETMLVKKDDKIGKYCAFVCFKDGRAAEKLVQSFQQGNAPANPFGEPIPLYVNFSQTRQERDEILRKRKQGANNENNLYVKNLTPEVSKEALTEAFSQFGVVISCDVRRWDATTNTPGVQYGFVAFKTPEEATRARNAAHENAAIKKLFKDEKSMVYPFQNKEQRRKFLSTQWRRRFPGMAGFPYGPNPEMRRDLFNPNRRIGGMMPPQQFPGVQPFMAAPQGGYHRGPQNKRPFMPQQGGMRPQQGYHAQQRGPRPDYNNNRPDRLGQQGRGPRPQGMQHDHPNAFANPAQRTQVPQQQAQIPQQQPQQRVAAKPQAQPEEPKKPVVTIQTLKAQWESFTQLDKEKQRNILGELLFPLIKDRVGDVLAPKITGMLIDLEVLEIQEIFEFLEDQDLLHERIEEAKNLILSEGA